jgi:hypothetical protein
VIALTNHAVVRARQRGLRKEDVDFILRVGTDIGDGVMLTVKDAQEIITEAKRIINRAERLKNVRVVAADGKVITAFHATRRQQRYFLRA